MTLLASPSNIFYLFFRGELCAVKHSAVLGIWRCFLMHTLLFFYVRVARLRKCMLTWSFHRKQHKRSIFFQETITQGKVNGFADLSWWGTSFILIMGRKLCNISEVAGLESLVKMWCDVIREWMKLIQRKSNQNRLSNRAFNSVIPVFPFIINI